MDPVLAARLERLRARRGARSVAGKRARAGAGGAFALQLASSWRLRLLAGLAAAALLGAAFLWFRSSPLVAVSEVRISGVRGPQASTIEATLRAAARRQSTLAPSAGALRRALSAFPQVRSLAISTSFPHAMRISVQEQLPVAILQASDGARSAAAADGALLGGGLARSALPVLQVPALSSADTHEQPLDSYLTLLGAAPEALLPYVGSLQDGAKGVTATLRDGLTVYLGDGEAARAKWLSLARVLLATNLAQLRYVDVREPQRPAAGMLAGSEAAGAGAGSANGAVGSAAGSTAEQAGLVATLQRALGAGPSASPEALSPSGGGGGSEAAGAQAGGEAPGGEGAPATSSGAESAAGSTPGAEGGSAPGG